MIQLALMLMGWEFVRRYRRVLLALGAVWLLLGVAIFIDGLDGVLYFPLQLFGYLLLLQGVATFALIPKVNNRPLVRATRYFQGFVFILASFLIILGRNGDFLLAMLFGTLFLLDGVLRIASALVVRFARWKTAVAVGGVQLALAAFMYQPYPTHYVGTLPDCIGLWFIVSGASLMGLALRLEEARRIHAAQIARDERNLSATPAPTAPIAPAASTPASNAARELVIHVWTAVGTAEHPVPPRPVIDRYLIAVDSAGVVSTGHSAVEIPNDFYISHYPKIELEHSDEELRQILLATPENNVEGLFQPSYAKESSDWCDSTEKIKFKDFNEAQLRAFWDDYSKDNTYNLTNRSCSTTAVRALEAAIGGVVGRQTPGWRGFLRVMFSPELWVASHLRTRGQTMAWTPGLVLDYSRALRGIVHPPPVSWLEQTRLVMDVYRLSRPNAAPRRRSKV